MGRNPVPIPLDGVPLQPVDLDRVVDEEQRADRPALERRVDVAWVLRQRQTAAHERSEVKVLGQLARLLLQRHIRDQLVHPGPDARVGSTGVHG